MCNQKQPRVAEEHLGGGIATITRRAAKVGRLEMSRSPMVIGANESHGALDLASQKQATDPILERLSGAK